MHPAPLHSRSVAVPCRHRNNISSASRFPQAPRGAFPAWPPQQPFCSSVFGPLLLRLRVLVLLGAARAAATLRGGRFMDPPLLELASSDDEDAFLFRRPDVRGFGAFLTEPRTCVFGWMPFLMFRWRQCARWGCGWDLHLLEVLF